MNHDELSIISKFGCDEIRMTLRFLSRTSGRFLLLSFFSIHVRYTLPAELLVNLGQEVDISFRCAAHATAVVESAQDADISSTSFDQLQTRSIVIECDVGPINALGRIQILLHFEQVPIEMPL